MPAPAPAPAFDAAAALAVLGAPAPGHVCSAACLEASQVECLCGVFGPAAGVDCGCEEFFAQHPHAL